MTKLLRKLWNDDCGALITVELLFVVTILIIGLVVGLASLRNAITAELEELANAILALSQGYSVGGLSGCCASVEGSQAIDINGLVVPHVCTAPIPSVIEVTACP